MSGFASRSFGPAGHWRAWHERHAARLLLYARQWLPQRADAEDAVQAGFVKFWRSKPEATNSDTPLLYATVRCAALDLVKRNSRRIRREEHAMEDAEDVWWDADTIAARERAHEIRHALERLPLAQREVIVLRVWAELGFAEIACALGENINTISARYRYGLASLKKFIIEENHERI